MSSRRRPRGNAGVYAAVLVEGLVKAGDEIAIDDRPH